MKIFFYFTLLFLSLSIIGHAQDLITMKTGEEVQAKVLKVSIAEITYKKWENIEGPDYMITKADVFMIKYSNGQKDVFSLTTSFAQESKVDTPLRRNAVFVDLGGVGYFLSLNYERMFFINNNTFVAWRGGVSPMGSLGTISTAVTLNIGSKTDFFEFGVGTGYYYGINTGNNNTENYQYVTPVLGYRRISKSGFMFKTYFSMLTLKEGKWSTTTQTYNNGLNGYSTQTPTYIYSNAYYPFVGVSFGLAF